MTFALVSPATPELFILVNSVELGTLSPVEAAPRILEALDFGADPEPGAPVHAQALVILARSWTADAAASKALGPVRDRLIEQSSPAARQNALARMLTRLQPRTGQQFMRQLIGAGATVNESGVFSALSFPLEATATVTDTQACKLVDQVIRLGWIPQGGVGEERALSSLITGRRADALGLWINHHVACNKMLSATLGEVTDPIALIMRHQGYLKPAQKKASEQYNRMAKAIARSGRLPEHPKQTWRHAKPGTMGSLSASAARWLFDAMAEGEAARLEHATAHAPDTRSRGPRL